MKAPIIPLASTQGIVSKNDIINQPSPPAYSPGPQIPSQKLASRQPQLHTVMTDDFTALIASQQEREYDDTDSDMCLSSISLRINTSIRVSSDNNYICIKNTPSDHANAIARAIVNAIQENSSGRCGIPMIDEDGRPRPIKVEVDAGVEVMGSGNVLGSEAVINEALARRKQSRCQKRHLEDSCEIDGHESIEPVKRRKCR